jgi:alkyl sulfatase BDS1-like metallo-beta-lactamase superfamily hydrolase
MMADAMIRLSWTDAQALAAGDLTSADALREGKIKIRGDFSVLVTVQPWLQAAFTPS